VLLTRVFQLYSELKTTAGCGRKGGEEWFQIRDFSRIFLTKGCKGVKFHYSSLPEKALKGGSGMRKYC
jgi:hypothetical protein